MPSAAAHNIIQFEFGPQRAPEAVALITLSQGKFFASLLRCTMQQVTGLR